MNAKHSVYPATSAMNYEALTTLTMRHIDPSFSNFASLIPDNKVHGANMGPIWVRLDLSDPGGPHAGPMNFANWEHNTFISPW